MTAPARVALVGAGAMGLLHARVLKRTGRGQLAVVVDRHRDRAQRIADEVGCAATDRLEDALDCDAAIVATPAEHHRDVTVAFLEAGRPVLVEISQRCDVPLMCGFVERFNPAVSWALERLCQAPVRMVAVRHSPPAARARCGVVHDMLIHDIDLAIRFAGDGALERIRPPASPPGRSNESAGCVLGFAGGAVASLSASRLGQHRLRTFAIETPEMRMELDLARQRVAVLQPAYGARDDLSSHLETRIGLPQGDPREDPLTRQLDHFLALVEGRADADRERGRLLTPHLVAAQLIGSQPV